MSTPAFAVQPVAPFWTPAAWLRHACEAAIGGYQRWLSPHKGYCCAHRVVHKGESCSQFVKRAIHVGGVRQAAGLAMKRFDACGRAFRRLERQRRRDAALLVAGGAVMAVAEEDEDAQRRRDHLCEEAIDGAFELAEAAGEEALGAALEAVGSAIADGLGVAAEATGEVLAGGLDLAGAACEGLASAGGECAGGLLAGGCAF